MAIETVKPNGPAGSKAGGPSTVPRRSPGLAQALKQHLGLDGARRIARENHWHGVLQALQRDAR